MPCAIGACEKRVFFPPSPTLLFFSYRVTVEWRPVFCPKLGSLCGWPLCTMPVWWVSFVHGRASSLSLFLRKRVKTFPSAVAQRVQMPEAPSMKVWYGGMAVRVDNQKSPLIPPTHPCFGEVGQWRGGVRWLESSDQVLLQLSIVLSAFRREGRAAALALSLCRTPARSVDRLLCAGTKSSWTYIDGLANTLSINQLVASAWLYLRVFVCVVRRVFRWRFRFCGMRVRHVVDRPEKRASVEARACATSFLCQAGGLCIRLCVFCVPEAPCRVLFI